LRQLGCTLQPQQDGAMAVTGLGGQLPVQEAALFLGNAGTAMRPLAAALAVLAALQGGRFELSGVPRMHERPIADLVDALRQLGCNVDYLGSAGYPPLLLRGETGGKLQTQAEIRVRGDVSSQFLTALLLALPLASASAAVVIAVDGELLSKPYVDITLKLLARFGVEVQRTGWQQFVITAGSRLCSPGELHVEADASSASYFIALGAIAPGNGLRIDGVGADSIQGDIRFIDAARMMGAQIDSGANWLQVSRAPELQGRTLRAIDLDCNHIPDAAMTLAVMALYASGTTTLRNIASWRVKETDRIAAMASELRKFGATVEEGDDFIRVTAPPSAAHWRSADVATYDDHRIAMCFSLAAFNPAQLPVRIRDPRCVAKTFPDYFESLFGVVQAQPDAIPVICVDGPTASGKGTLASELARRLGYHFLDSGALYRIAALAAIRAGLTLDAANENAIAALASRLAIRFEANRIWLDGEDLSDAIRSEAMGMNASAVSALAEVRRALLGLQHAARRLPGLVADGRDMGTVIFPHARLKVYLTASAERRAQRRHQQLGARGISATIAALRTDLEARDARDSSRSTAPLKPAQDARLLDNSDLNIEESVGLVLNWWNGLQPFGKA